MAQTKQPAGGGALGGISGKTLAALGVVGVGAWLIWRQFSKPKEQAYSPSAQAMITTDSMAPGVSSAIMAQQLPGTVAPTYGSPATVPPMTMPSQAYPYATQPTDIGTAVSAVAPGTSKENYLAMIGNPKAGATVTGPLPPAGLFPEFKGSAGPKQKACLKAGGTWTGPAGKKFCVKPG